MEDVDDEEFEKMLGEWRGATGCRVTRQPAAKHPIIITQENDIWLIFTIKHLN